MTVLGESRVPFASAFRIQWFAETYVLGDYATNPSSKRLTLPS
jgi:hypothetical protein